jgi:hypothetical protein
MSTIPTPPGPVPPLGNPDPADPNKRDDPDISPYPDPEPEPDEDPDEQLPHDK